MDYKVSEVKSYSDQTYGKFGSHRTTFLVEGNSNILSAFVKAPLSVGQVLSGEIKTVEKDGKTYTNFEFTKKGSVDNDKIDDKLETLLNRVTGISMRVESILAILKAKDSKYPKESNETAFDEVNPDDVPF